MIGRIATAAVAALAAASAVAAAGWGWPAAVSAPRIPAGNPMNQAKVELGRRLFYDADLSIDGTMACATCHEQHRGFADGNTNHPGVHGDPARRNVPGLANVAWVTPLTWGDPRQRTLEEQARVPILGNNPVEMGMEGKEAEIARRLSRDACYVTTFRAAFPEKSGRIDIDTVVQAIAAFERTLVSTDAPYDRAQRGGPALTGAAAEGEALFRRDCAACHAGANFTDGRFHNVAVWTSRDPGLGEITGRLADNGRFRTPGLRNVAVTGPYLHDGSARTIAQAIASHPGERSAGEVAALVAFLGTLTDETFLSDRKFALPDTACGQPL